MAEERLIHIFEQNWIHIRHMEHYRIWCVNTYAVVMAGITYALSTGKLEPYFAFVAGFLMILTMTYLLIALKVEAIIRKFVSHNGAIIKKMKVKEYAPVRTREGIWVIIRLQYLFPVFYGACMILIITAIALHFCLT